MARTNLGARSPQDCRLYDVSTGQDLLLDGSSAQVLIVDVHASVNLSQHFTNSSNAIISSVVYTFGIMAGVAVCEFEMIRQDGTRVEGVVKEKGEAKKVYEQAIKAGKTASLGQEETADVFSITVGNILPSETVEINLRYLQPLTDDEKKDQVKFIFPRTYAQRYGHAPTNNSAQGATVQQPFSMNVVVQQSGVIRSISCPSAHPIQLELGLPEELSSSSEDSSHFASVALTDTSGFLTQDVVLIISATNLDTPRCFIEPHPSPNHETTAMALTFVPKFTLPDAKSGMEYVFVVDRSGSMRGERIKLVQDALIVLLRGLPTSGTTFNVVSFGTRATKLWESSRQYSQISLEEATNHVDAMRADYGGTEIASALSLAYSSLTKPLLRPVAVILLTDGSAWDVSTCVSHTEAALSSLPIPNDLTSFIRVFAVGIGYGASSATCDSIARAGNGFAVYVKQGEALAGKCARVVRAARTPVVADLVVDWTGDEVFTGADTQESLDVVEDENDGFEMVDSTTEKDSERIEAAPTLNLFSDDDDETMTEAQSLHSTGPPLTPEPLLPPPPAIQRAPLVLTNMFPGTRTQVYAILRTPQNENGVKGDRLPTTVKVKGIVGPSRTPVELVVPVLRLLHSPKPKSQSVSNAGDLFQQTFLHILAAKELITDRQNGRHVFPHSIADKFQNDGELKDVYLKKEIVRLGTMYGLASKYTSFVAVDHRVEELDSGSSTSNSTSNNNNINIIPISERRAAVQSRRMGSGKAARRQLAPRSAAAAGMGAVPVSLATSASHAARVPTSRTRPQVYARPRPLYFEKPSQPPPIQGLHQSWGSPQSWDAQYGVSLSEEEGHSSTSERRRKRMKGGGTPVFLDLEADIASSASSSSTIPSPHHQQERGREQVSVDSGQDRNRERERVPAPTIPSASVTTPPAVPTLPSSIPVPTNMTSSDRLTAIARLQKFNGQLVLTSALLVLLGISDSVQEVEAKLGIVSVSGDVGATVLAWAWMEGMGGRERAVDVGEEVLSLLEKAKEWVECEVGGMQSFADLNKKVLNALNVKWF